MSVTKINKAAVDVVLGNNNLIREALLVMDHDPKYRMTTAMIDTFISILKRAEEVFKDQPSIDLVGAYAETVDLVSKVLIKHEMYHMAQMIADNSEIVKKEVLKPLFSA